MIEPAQVTRDIRLVDCLGDPVDATFVGPALRREILFHVLRYPRGPTLAAYAMQTGDDGRLDARIDRISRNFALRSNSPV